jgi:hypothetical protein
MRLDHRRDLGPHGELVELLVGLNDKVDVGQKVAIQRNAFDKVVAEYICGSAGEVTVCRTDATSKPGTPLVFILFDSAPQERTAARSRVSPVAKNHQIVTSARRRLSRRVRPTLAT